MMAAAQKAEKPNFIRDCTEKFIKILLRIKNTDDKHDFTEIKVPMHLKEFVPEQLKNWINSALIAMNELNLKNDYLLDANNQIVPVDADNTGIVQIHSQWTNGLHKFLQIKYGTKVTPEPFMTNHISNIAFFKRYKSNIFGLTGTLGIQSTQQLIEEFYSVACCIIPPFSVKQHCEFTPIIEPDKDDWFETIIASISNKLDNKHAVLVICKHISVADEIADSLTKRLEKSQVKIYKEAKRLWIML